MPQARTGTDPLRQIRLRLSCLAPAVSIFVLTTRERPRRPRAPHAAGARHHRRSEREPSARPRKEAQSSQNIDSTAFTWTEPFGFLKPHPLLQSLRTTQLPMISRVSWATRFLVANGDYKPHPGPPSAPPKHPPSPPSNKRAKYLKSKVHVLSKGGEVGLWGKHTPWFSTGVRSKTSPLVSLRMGSGVQK